MDTQQGKEKGFLFLFSWSGRRYRLVDHKYLTHEFLLVDPLMSISKSKELSELLRFFEARYFDGVHVQKDMKFCPLSILCPTNPFLQLTFSIFLCITCCLRISAYTLPGSYHKTTSVILSKKAILSMNIIARLFIQHFIILLLP